jgi:UDP-N-acetylmuramoylalanine--D-glutamate ligase
VTLDELCARRVAVWGLGQEGRDMVRLLRVRGVSPLVIDDRLDDRPDGSRVGPDGEPLPVVAPGAVDWSGLDVVVRSPGVSRYRPELARAAAHGVSVTTAMAVWLEDFGGAQVLAVTGTKGKSTTAALAASMLRAGGVQAALIGNIGVPVTETYDRPPVDAYVVEVSSYQAAEVTVTPRVCVLTSLAPDHLDWHGGVEAYFRDKLRLIEAGPHGALAVNAGSAEAVHRTADHPDRLLFGPSGRVRVAPGGAVEVDGEPVSGPDALQVPGRHNLWNLCGAIAGCLLLTGEPPSSAALAAVCRDFAGLPSRCHTVGDRDGLTFVDDALASNPFATMASLEAFPGREVTLILGGADRGVDPDDLITEVNRRRPRPRIVLLPPGTDRLVARLASVGEQIADGGVACSVAADMGDAVRLAVEKTPPGGVVLFSPAAPTPAGEGGYTERSRQFIHAAGFEPDGAARG